MALTFRVSGHLKTQGEAVGINFTGKVDRYPYTLTAHALLEYAKSVDDTYAKQNQLQEVIFQVRGMVVETGRRKRKKKVRKGFKIRKQNFFIMQAIKSNDGKVLKSSIRLMNHLKLTCVILDNLPICLW